MKPFYLNEHSIIVFPKREIYNSVPHEIWFRDEGIPIFGVIRGYFNEDNITVFINEFDIPPIHPAVIMDWFNTFNSLNYVGLGANKVDNIYVPKLIIFKGATIPPGSLRPEELEKDKKEVKEENLIDEASKISEKEKIGF
jgi:hypothetical protein